MADEKLDKPDEGGSDNPDQVTIDRAELETLRQQSEQFGKIAARAKEADYEDVTQYTSDLETELQRFYAKEEEMNAQPEAKPEVKSEVKPKEQSTVGLSDEQLKMIQANDLRAAQAFLQSQKTEYKLAQMSLPEEKRTNITDNELLKVINDRSLQPLVRNLAGKFDGNVYAAAAHYLTVAQGIEAARQEGKDTQAAIEAAVGSASLGTGGKVADVSNKSAEEKAAEFNKQAADDIAPDDVP